MNFDNPVYEGMELSEIVDSPSETSKEPGNGDEEKFKLCKVNFILFYVFYATCCLWRI